MSVANNEATFRAKFLKYIDGFNSERLLLGSTSIAIFALVVSLLVYAFYSWADTFNYGMSQREQVLHIAIPIFFALTLIPMAVNNLYVALKLSSEDRE